MQPKPAGPDTSRPAGSVRGNKLGDRLSVGSGQRSGMGVGSLSFSHDALHRHDPGFVCSSINACLTPSPSSRSAHERHECSVCAHDCYEYIHVAQPLAIPRLGDRSASGVDRRREMLQEVSSHLVEASSEGTVVVDEYEYSHCYKSESRLPNEPICLFEI